MRIILNKMGFNFGLDNRFFNFGIHLNQRFYGISKTIGIRNNCIDSKKNASSGNRIIFLDYDEILLKEMLIPEIKYLQQKYELGNFYIFKSSQKPNSFHAVCFDKVKVYEWKDIMEESSCDENYKKPSLKDFKTAVLRIAPKGSSNAPSYLMTIKSPIRARIKSLAHYNFFKFNYDLPDEEIFNMDESDNLLFVEYETQNYLKNKR